ncbi:uncharacterized protein LOC135210349 isoform X1 [Macrobrachium nipponense]|uniref:uncharacterized protein LOC135210349 isoform X1 n=2 Tax=Macrobrachium nipponense TaxID=159736 RepID=UPI0030C85E7E
MSEGGSASVPSSSRSPLTQEARTLDRAPSREDFTKFESIVNMPRGSQLPKRVPKEDPDNVSYDEEDGGGVGNCLAAIIQVPVLIAAAIIVPIFGLTFIVCGIVFISDCKIEPMIPVWLIVQGFILLFGIGIGGVAKKTSKDGGVNIVVKIVSFIIFLFTSAWFIAGNYFIYQAWAKDPDYAHFWYNNGCNPALFKLSFVCIIVLDCLFAVSFVVGILAFCLRGCKRR